MNDIILLPKRWRPHWSDSDELGVENDLTAHKAKCTNTAALMNDMTFIHILITRDITWIHMRLYSNHLHWMQTNTVWLPLYIIVQIIVWKGALYSRIDYYEWFYFITYQLHNMRWSHSQSFLITRMHGTSGICFVLWLFACLTLHNVVFDRSLWHRVCHN